MKDILELKQDLKQRREEFNRYRIANGPFGKAQFKEWLQSQSSTPEEEMFSETELTSLISKNEQNSSIDEPSTKRYERTMRQGYFKKTRRY